MTTLKGAIRTYGTMARKMERAQQKREREAAKKIKELQKIQEIEDAKQAVIDWNAYMNSILSIHKECTSPLKWDQIINTPEPSRPKKDLSNEIIAQKNLDNFKPSFFDKIFNTSSKKINRLKLNLDQAKEKDQISFIKLSEDYSMELENWKILHDISLGIKNNNLDDYINALDYFYPFTEIIELGYQIIYKINNSILDIEVHFNNSEIIPSHELKQTANGKLSKKVISKSKINELYQDHIASTLIRVAREVFACLPINYSRISAISNILNTKTGHLENQPILSVNFKSETFSNLNLEAIDPSDSILNFVHNMKFNKTKGFSVIEKVDFLK